MTPTSRQARIRRISDGVVASYIHDISARTAPAAPSAPARRHGRVARPARARAARRGHEDLARARIAA